MATKIAEQKMYECEVKRRKLKASGSGYEPFWKVKLVSEAVVDGDTEFRCKECRGSVTLHKRNTANGPTPHVEHKLKRDSEYCSLGLYFLQANDGRETRISASPVH